ncbi:hypothetical protein TNCV_2529451 [Trichonephila clavipes]|nr:hypothetical protein TNCV_2529451 [Trichonephila clavipes]
MVPRLLHVKEAVHFARPGSLIKEGRIRCGYLPFRTRVHYRPSQNDRHRVMFGTSYPLLPLFIYAILLQLVNFYSCRAIQQHGATDISNISDGAHKLQPCSSDEYDTRAGNPAPSYHTKPSGEFYDRFNVY